MIEPDEPITMADVVAGVLLIGLLAGIGLGVYLA